MRRRRNHPRREPVAAAGREEMLLARARRARRRGETRRAFLSLREAAQGQQHDARLWTMYGVQAAQAGKLEDALQALGHAVWLRERARDTARARVTHTLCSQLAAGGTCALRARFAA